MGSDDRRTRGGADRKVGRRGTRCGSGRRPGRWRFPAIAFFLAWIGPAWIAASAVPAAAQEPGDTIALSLERMVQLGLSTSYQVQFLNLSVEQTRQRLRAERARLRSNVSLDVSAPDFQSVSESQYNAVLGRNEIVRENSRRWEARLAVRQPVILFGYPTNGYLSANNRVYRYTQIDEEGGRDITYYNRYFLRYTQPLFQPNSLRNSLEQAELDLEDEELSYREDVVELVEDAARDYYSLFENAYEQVISQEYVDNLERAEAAAAALAEGDSARAIELDQIRIELANAREQLQRRRSDFRLQAARLGTRLNLEGVVFTLDPVMEIEPVEVDLEQARRYARELTPRLRQLDISRREAEIRLEETRGRNSFRVDLEFTYGREMREPVFGRLMSDPSNTYTVDVSAYIPVWDWGERSARVEASRVNLRRTDLRIEQAEGQIDSNVENEVANVRELQERTLTMDQNLELARSVSEQTLVRYAQGSGSVLDLLQSFRRQSDTAQNLLDAYVGWRRSLQSLQELTFYDFEYDLPVLERYGIDLGAMQRGF